MKITHILVGIVTIKLGKDYKTCGCDGATITAPPPPRTVRPLAHLPPALSLALVSVSLPATTQGPHRQQLTVEDGVGGTDLPASARYISSPSSSLSLTATSLFLLPLFDGRKVGGGASGTLTNSRGCGRGGGGLGLKFGVAGVGVSNISVHGRGGGGAEDRRWWRCDRRRRWQGWMAGQRPAMEAWRPMGLGRVGRGDGWWLVGGRRGSRRPQGGVGRRGKGKAV
jgi:hypothetical protein